MNMGFNEAHHDEPTAYVILWRVSGNGRGNVNNFSAGDGNVDGLAQGQIEGHANRILSRRDQPLPWVATRR